MSFSVSTSGTIAICRSSVSSALSNWSGESLTSIHSKRIVSHAINLELDSIEAAGGTHATVSASGHSDDGSRYYNINVSRDCDAEKTAQEEKERQERYEWKEQGLQRGWLGSASGSSVSPSSSSSDSEASGSRRKAY